jgi:hypothetical protein
MRSTSRARTLRRVRAWNQRCGRSRTRGVSLTCRGGAAKSQGADPLTQYSGRSSVRDFSSFAAMTVITGLSCALAYGSALRKIARICSNCTATRSAVPCPPLLTTMKFGLVTSTHCDLSAGRGIASSAIARTQVANLRVILAIVYTRRNIPEQPVSQLKSRAAARLAEGVRVAALHECR